MMAATNEVYVHCRNEWIQAYNEGPHTSFLMFRDVMSALRLRPRDIFRDPTPLSTFDFRQLNDDDLRSLLHHYTVGDSPGRCTTFALRVARRLQRNYPGDRFQFEYFDLGRHRVARCKSYKFVIDSESRRGIEELPDGVAWSSTPNRERGRWKYPVDPNNPNIPSHSVFEDWTGDSRIPRNIRPIAATRAFGICLQQVAHNFVLVCLFRSFLPEQPGVHPSFEEQEEKAQFHGSVRWRIARRRIELTPDIEKGDQIATITFGEIGGTAETNRMCARKLVSFIRGCGIEHQWRSGPGSIDEFNKELWVAALLEWGYPVYNEEY